jgi:hypothetical protein
VLRLRDEDPVRHPNDPPRLAQDDLDLAGIAVVTGRELDGFRSWVDAGQVDDGALGFRHDLLGDDEHVVEAEREGVRRPLERVADEPGEIVAEADLGDPVERDDRNRRGARAVSPAAVSPAAVSRH